MKDTTGIIERFLGGDPVAGNQALGELVALGEAGEDALFSKSIEYPPTVQIRRRWLRYVASRRTTVANRLLERMRNQSQFKDEFAIAFLFAGLPKDSAANVALYQQMELSLKSLLDDYDPSTRLFMAWGHAGGDAATLWHFISGNSYAWEKLCTFAFRASCASFARVNADDNWAIEQLITHEWRDYELIEIGDSPEARIAHESVAGYELWGEANHSLLMWRRGDVADVILRDWSMHQHWRVRDFGAQVLASLGFTRLVSPVIEWLRREEVPTIRRSLLHALERTEREAGADALLEHFLATDQEGRANVARSAWRASDKSRASAALMRIGDDDDTAAAESVVALAWMGHRHPRLKRSLDSGDRHFRLNAALAVAYLGDTAKLPHLSAMLREAAAPIERVFLMAALAILGRPNGAEELNRELIAMASAPGFDERLDIFFMHRYLQIAVLDGLHAGGDATAELWQTWQSELEPLDPVPSPVEVPPEGSVGSEELLASLSNESGMAASTAAVSAASEASQPDALNVDENMRVAEEAQREEQRKPAQAKGKRIQPAGLARLEKEHELAAEDTRPRSVFICHIAEEESVAVEIVTGLEAAGYSAWYYERDSYPGPDYLDQVCEAIDDCQVVLVLISTESVKSSQIEDEVKWAREQRKRFLPVLHSMSWAEFQECRPRWRMALGIASAIAIPPDGVSVILPRVVKGLEKLQARRAG